MNKKLLLIAGVAFASIGISTSAVAVQATGNASANVIVPMTITPVDALAFGDIVGGSAGTVSIAADGTPGGSLPSTGTQTAGTFDITGEGTKTFSITIPASTTITDGTDTMTVNGFSNTAGATGTLVGGALTIGVGATLNVVGGEGAGAYTGTYTVDVDYN